MLSRSTVAVTVGLAGLGLAGLAALPATAATKAKPFHGSKAVTAYPDPTTEVTNMGGKPGCTGYSPLGKTDPIVLAIPAKGKITVDLVSPDPTGKALTDWDLYIETPSGSIIQAGNGPTSSEEAVAKFTKAAKIQVIACNLAGGPSGTISWAYKPS